MFLLLDVALIREHYQQYGITGNSFDLAMVNRNIKDAILSLNDSKPTTPIIKKGNDRLLSSMLKSWMSYCPFQINNNFDFRTLHCLGSVLFALDPD